MNTTCSPNRSWIFTGASKRSCGCRRLKDRPGASESSIAQGGIEYCFMVAGPVLAVKSLYKTTKNQVTAVTAGKKTVQRTGPEGRFPTPKEAERLHIDEALRWH